MQRKSTTGPDLEVRLAQMSDPGLPAASMSTPTSPQHSSSLGESNYVTIDMTNAEGDLERIDAIPESQRIYIEIDNLSAFVPSLFGQPSFFQRLRPGNIKRKVAEGGSLSKPKLNQILFGVSGCVRPGEVLALMGPSGSGKTTMLSIMGGRAQRSMQVTGRVIFNGSPLNKNMKRKIGFVMQDDLLYESLTVHETLYYAAMLRLPRDMSKEDKLARVDAIIAALGLVKCKDTIVGGFFRRGISGGERKRASVGHELLINPSTLFLDEPTSGLDSTTALHLLQTLRTLAQGGRAVVTTIHQPSSRLYMQLDKLLLLSQGHAMYYGHAQQAVDYFEALGFPIPPRVNAADFILDLASGEVMGDQKTGEEARVHLIACSEAFLANNPIDGFDMTRDEGALAALSTLSTTGLIEAQQKKDALEDSPQAGNGLSHAKSAIGTRSVKWIGASFRYVENLTASKLGRKGAAAADDGDTALGGSKDDRWGASFGMQIRILFQRSLRTRRFQSLSMQDICQLVIIAILAGLFWLQRGQQDTLAAGRDILGVLFFMLMFLSFRSLFVSLFTFPEEQRHMLKERASGMYRLSAFYIARLLSDFPADMSIPTVFIIIVYFMVGLRLTAGAFFGIYGTLLLSLFVAQSLGLLLGSYFMNPKTAQTVAAVLMLTIVLTGGFFVSNIPDWIGWLKYLSYIYYSFGILLYLQYDAGNVVVYSCTGVTEGNQCTQTNPSDPANDPSCIPVQNINDSLGLLQDITSTGEAVRNGMVLLAFLVVLRIAVYYVLRKKTSGF